MSDETVNDNGASQPSGSTERVGFCQDCGRPLTREDVRTVGSGIFCEPCLEARMAGRNAGATAPPYGTAPPPPNTAGPVYTEPFPPVGGNSPSPVLAALLGLIPGVGAMYNGQFAKGIAHIVIFALLQSMARVSDFFGFLVAGWIFYQAFEAYHTAKARREGMPLPDPLGLNNIGVQVGAHFRGTAAGAPPNPAQAYPGYAAPEPVGTPAGGPAWGSVPVTPPVSPYAQSAPYTPPPPVWDTPVWTPPPPPTVQEWASTYSNAPAYPMTPVRRNTVPTAAAWLIGLGVIFMIFNFMPEWRFSVHKVFPFLLMAFAIWVFMRRMFATGGLAPREDEGAAYSARAVCFLRFPVILFTISVLWMLEEFRVFRFGQTWPVLVIVLGVLLLLERSIGSRAVPVTPIAPAPDASGVDGKGI